MKILDTLRLPLPGETERNVREINYDKLINLGYDTILFDYDNTIAVWRSAFDMRNKPIIDSLLEKGMKVAVVTNAPWKRINNMKGLFGNRVKLYHSMQKPGIRGLQRVLQELHSKPEKTVIIGDLFLTDVIAGNRLGMHTVMVRPAAQKTERWYKRFMATMTIWAYKTFFFTIGWFFNVVDMATPHYFVDDVSEIDFAVLNESGYKLVVFDFDNTLEPWKSTSISKDRILLLKAVERLGMKVAIISNGKKERIQKVASAIPGLYAVGEARKPFPIKVSKLAKSLGIPPHKIVIIGDQLFTDVTMGNLLGSYTIKVEPISDNEFFWTRFMRRIEKIAIKAWRKKPRVEEMKNEM